MTDKFSVIFEPAAMKPFGIIEDRSGILTAYPVHESAEHWALRYNGGNKQIPYGMQSSEFVSMDTGFVEGFRSTFSGGDRVGRRAALLSRKTEKLIASEIIYGASLGRAKRRKNGVNRKVMPAVAHRQMEFFRAGLIDRAIRKQGKWPKKEKD